MRNRNQCILGRVNYLSFKADCFNVIFTPFRGSNACILARNLSKEDALNLIDTVNEALDAIRLGVDDEEEEEN